MKTVLTLSIFLVTASAKVFEKCELAGILKNGGLDGFMGYPLKDWVCFVQRESSYRTDAVNHDRRTHSTDYGLFQINSKWWCDDGMTSNSRNGCRKNCADFLDDDISDDVQCAKRVVSDPQGMRAWYAWVNYCRRESSSLLRECGL
ncbi:lysozyme C-1-like [Pristis pectinata]|uniref:lysozyme C-1-like n=1 Tax=Pristis pectinata TaxID=685728 RepID=UPI00223CF340|nr:lysozyme C-1-like [Pristis pectinata]